MTEYDDKKSEMRRRAEAAHAATQVGVYRPLDGSRGGSVQVPSEVIPQGDPEFVRASEQLNEEFTVNQKADVVDTALDVLRSAGPDNAEQAEKTALGLLRALDQYRAKTADDNTSYDVVAGWSDEPTDVRRSALRTGIARLPGNDSRTDPQIQSSLESRQETDYEAKWRRERDSARQK